MQACALVAGAAALVLEKYPDYTPAQVKQHLIDEATDGAINMKMSPEANEGANKLLYVGYGEIILIVTKSVHSFITYVCLCYYKI